MRDHDLPHASTFGLAILIALLIFALPHSAQQLPAYDEARVVDELTTQLQLSSGQVARLQEILAGFRPQIEGLRTKGEKLQREGPGSGIDPVALRGELEGLRRSVLEKFLPALSTEQQGRVRQMLAAPRPPRSPIPPLKPRLPSGLLSNGEALIPLVRPTENTSTRSRRASQMSLSADQKILHFLNRAGYGPRPGDVERVRKMGLDRYLEQQLHPENLADELLDQPLLALGSLQMSLPEVVQNFMPPPPMPRPTPSPNAAAGGAMTSEKGETPAAPPIQTPPLPPPPPRDPQLPLRELQQAKLLRAVFSERQLQEVMTDFWFNHFNVFAGKDADRWLITSFERDVIRPHALGKFKELLVATAESPAMLFYLDNFLSQGGMPAPRRANEQPARRPGLNENYARELMELHTLGVNGGYTQKDVIEVARCFTGWSLGPRPAMTFVFRPRTHDRGEKVVLGSRITAGGGIEDGLRVLDLLARHPSTSRFIARKLCMRFVADEPPAELVDRAAATFTRTGGDIREVVRTILTSSEFYAPASYRRKIKSPLEYAASAIRATGASTDGAVPLGQWVARMGEPLYLYQAPTGYSEESARWINHATLIERMNFALALTRHRIDGTRLDLSRLVAFETFANAALDPLIALLIHSDVSTGTRAALTRAIAESATRLDSLPDERARRKAEEEAAAALVALLLGAQEFQVK